MADDKEIVTLKLPSGENVDFVVPSGLSDSEVKNFVLSKRPDLFSNAAQKAASPTQFEQERSPQNHQGVVGTLSGMLQGALPSIGRRLLGGGLDPVGDIETIKSMIKAPSSTNSVAGKIVAPLGPLVGVDPTSMAEAANRGDTGSVATQAAVPALTAVLAAGGKAAGEAFSPEALRAQAGGTLGQLKAQAGKIPVNTSQLGDTALEIMTQTGRGAQSVPAVNKLIARITKPGSEPLTYAEAKDFQSNITNLLRAAPGDPGSPLKNPNTFRLVSDLNAKLKSALEQASTLSGAPEGTFTDAMHNYSVAASRQQMIDRIHDLAMKGLKLGAGGIVGGSAAKLGYDIAKIIKGDSK